MIIDPRDFERFRDAWIELRDEVYYQLHIPQLARWLNDKLTTITRWLQ